MSMDNVWDQKHASTSSIKSSDLLGVDSRNLRVNLGYVRTMPEATRDNADGTYTFRHRVIESDGTKIIRDEIVDGLTYWWEGGQPRKKSFLKSLFT